MKNPYRVITVVTDGTDTKQHELLHDETAWTRCKLEKSSGGKSKLCSGYECVCRNQTVKQTALKGRCPLGCPCVGVDRKENLGTD
jgi:hypothetical protein